MPQPLSESQSKSEWASTCTPIVGYFFRVYHCRGVFQLARGLSEQNEPVEAEIIWIVAHIKRKGKKQQPRYEYNLN